MLLLIYSWSRNSFCLLNSEFKRFLGFRELMVRRRFSQYTNNASFENRKRRILLQSTWFVLHPGSTPTGDITFLPPVPLQLMLTTRVGICTCHRLSDTIPGMCNTGGSEFRYASGYPWLRPWYVRWEVDIRLVFWGYRVVTEDRLMKTRVFQNHISWFMRRYRDITRVVFAIRRDHAIKEMCNGSYYHTKLFGSQTDIFQIFPHKGGPTAALAARSVFVDRCLLVSSVSERATITRIALDCRRLGGRRRLPRRCDTLALKHLSHGAIDIVLKTVRQCETLIVCVIWEGNS